MIINELRKINDKLIVLNQNNKDELNKQLLIKRILKEDNCFSKINTDISFSILKDLRVPEDKIKNIYMSIIRSTITN